MSTPELVSMQQNQQQDFASAADTPSETVLRATIHNSNVMKRHKVMTTTDDEDIQSPTSAASPATPPASPPPPPPPPPPQHQHQEIGSKRSLEDTLPPSPPSADGSGFTITSSPLHDNSNIKRWIETSHHPVGVIGAKVLANTIDCHYSNPLPEVDSIFPWLHGLHPDNISQRAFLDPHTRFKHRLVNGIDSNIEEEYNNQQIHVPHGIKGLIIVKVGDEANELGSLVGSVTPKELLRNNKGDDFDFFENQVQVDDLIPKFLTLDPKEGISLRNFHIQVAKWGVLSDIVVYSPENVELAVKVATLFSQAQHDIDSDTNYKTFILDESIYDIMTEAPHVVAIPPKSMDYDEDELRLKNWDSNFLFHERVEMSMMSSASPIEFDGDKIGSVWLGNTVDFETYVELYQRRSEQGHQKEEDDSSLRSRNWATFIECFDGAQLPSVESLEEYINEAERILDGEDVELTPLSIQFPGSGSVSLLVGQQEDSYAIANLCKLIWLRSRVKYRGETAGVLIYCNDGYSETSLLALMYICYSTGVKPDQAWIDLHVKYSRPFFCFRRDISVTSMMEIMLLEFSPALPDSKHSTTRGKITNSTDHTKSITIEEALYEKHSTRWFYRGDGSSPSRILPHMYLGSLVHAENPEMLVKMGIKRVLSVGEKLKWVDLSNQSEVQPFHPGVVVDEPFEGITKTMYMGDIEDDGVDALMNNLANCLEFLDEGYRLNEPTLVHCRVGVSRSATVCIAEVMKRLGVGLPRAYLFVRVRRLNVIIQPNLRFMYELVKWEEQHRKSGEGWLREVDWHILCREIAIMNRAYIA